jgi:LEA14-like dessication related protein
MRITAGRVRKSPPCAVSEVNVRYLFLVWLTLALAGCSFLVGEPEVRVERLNVVGADSKGVDLELYLSVTNPNSFAVTLTGYSYDLQVTTLSLAKGGARNRVAFKGGTTTDLRLPLRVEYGALVEVLKRRPDPERVPYRLQAGLELATPLGQLLVPIDREETFAIPKEYRPDYYLQQLKGFFLGPN